MRWLAILAVLAYRVAIRPFYRRLCLHPESCSAFAIRVLRESRLRDGLRRTRARLRSCRMPIAACWVLEPDGTPRVLCAQTHDGGPMAPGTVALVTSEVQARAGTAHG